MEIVIAVGMGYLEIFKREAAPSTALVCLAHRKRTDSLVIVEKQWT